MIDLKPPSVKPERRRAGYGWVSFLSGMSSEGRRLELLEVIAAAPVSPLDHPVEHAGAALWDEVAVAAIHRTVIGHRPLQATDAASQFHVTLEVER